MKTNFIFRRNRLAVCLATALALTSCTGDFEELNTDPYGISDEQLVGDFNIIGLPFKQVQLSLYVNDPAWNTQLQQNLNADMYSGYMMSPTPYIGNVNNLNYSLVSGWNGQAWTDAYDMVMKPIAKIEAATKGKYDNFYAWSLILKVEAMHRVSDIYGPIIYTQFGKLNSDGSVKYDSQKDAYYAFFNDLETAINILTPLARTEASLITIPFKPFDYVYDGSYTKWVKFANTLRLRLAIRIAKKDAAKAKLEGEKALANEFGLLSRNSESFIVKTTTTHPLNVINNSWGDVRLGAPVESILGGYNDPRLKFFALPATDAAVKDQYKGIRLGVDIDAKTRYVDYSKLVTFPNQILLMTTAEAWFLKAEADLRGWVGAGDAEANYINGITASFQQYEAEGLTEYLEDNTSTQKPYIDPKSIKPEGNDIKAGSQYLSEVTIKWDNNADFETKLERIITQKWIAMYPEGQEAWSEFRRTGYPRLFPVVVNKSNGEIGDFIKRLEFVSNEYSTNAAGVAEAVTLLGGPDTGGTALWWDID